MSKSDEAESELAVRVKKAISKLDEVYNKTPKTKGCIENNSKSEEDGGCNSWCCRVQNPQVLYVEFLNSLDHVSNKWRPEKLSALLIRAVEQYLSKSTSKGCVFFDTDSNLCSQHESRPISCRTYGIMPEDEWKPRYEQLKVLYPEGKFRGQCELVSTEDGSEVTQEDTDRWFEDVVGIEESLGIPRSLISDKQGGTYRAYHDHIIMHFYPTSVIKTLNELKIKGTDEAKADFILQMKKSMDNKGKEGD